MKTPYKNIYNVLAINRLIVIACVLATVVICCFALFLNYKMNEKSLNSNYAVNTNGEVIPLSFVEQRENLEVEMKHHLDMFHNYFIGINQINYEKNIEKALWLGDASIEQSYKQKQASGVYNRILQYSLIQSIESIESRVQTEPPFAYITKVVFYVIRGEEKDKYELTTKGNIILLDDRNFPYNPHGMLISNYFEENLKRIENED